MGRGKNKGNFRSFKKSWGGLLKGSKTWRSKRLCTRRSCFPNEIEGKTAAGSIFPLLSKSLGTTVKRKKRGWGKGSRSKRERFRIKIGGLRKKRRRRISLPILSPGGKKKRGETGGGKNREFKKGPRIGEKRDLCVKYHFVVVNLGESERYEGKRKEIWKGLNIQEWGKTDLILKNEETESDSREGGERTLRQISTPDLCKRRVTRSRNRAASTQPLFLHFGIT